MTEEIIVSREKMAQILKESGAKCIDSCCSVPEKYCSADVWKVNMEAVIKLAFKAGQESVKEELRWTLYSKS